MLEVEKRNYAYVQDLLSTARREAEEMGSKWREGSGEIERLKCVVADFETERKTWSSLQQTFMESKVPKH
jgi:hypothetical protein